MNNVEQLDNALIDVRKAYRLLHAYQARVLDIVKYVSKQMHLSILSAWPWYSDANVKNKIDLDNWAFDWLPMYLYEYVLYNAPIQQKNCRFALIIVSDTGFFDATLHWKDRNNVNVFKPVEESSTQMVLMAGVEKWHRREVNMLNLFKKGAQLLKENDEGGTFLAKAYPLTQFIDATSIDDVLKDFTALCKNHGVAFIETLSPFKQQDLINVQ